MNPKDRIGSKKVGTGVVPPAAVFTLAQALMDGARKYGPFNWRDEPVQASIYLEAIDRHKALWSAGDEKADDSLVHHLGHVMGCCAILIDAQLHGKLIDDRHKSPEFVRFLKEANEWAKSRLEPPMPPPDRNIGHPSPGWDYVDSCGCRSCDAYRRTANAF